MAEFSDVERIFFEHQGNIHEFKTFRSHSMDLVYFQGMGPFECHPFFLRPAIFWARGHSRFSSPGPLASSGFLEGHNWGLLARSTPHTLKALTSTWQMAIMLPSDTLIERVSEVYHIAAFGLCEVFVSPSLMTRSSWQNELMHRYVFERLFGEALNPTALRFLEEEIIKELYFQYNKERLVRGIESEASKTDRSPLRRILNCVEFHLYDSPTLEKLASCSAVSRSSITRIFRDELKQTPGSYIQERRLKETLKLLRLSHHSSSEIAEIFEFDGLEDLELFVKKHTGHEVSSFRRPSKPPWPPPRSSSYGSTAETSPI